MTEQNIHLLWDSEIDNLIVDRVLETLSKVSALGETYPDATTLEIVTAVHQDILDNGIASAEVIVIATREDVPYFLEDAEGIDTSEDPVPTVDDEFFEGVTDDESFLDVDPFLTDENVEEETDDAISAIQAEIDEDNAVDLPDESEGERDELNADWDEALEDDAEWTRLQQEELDALQTAELEAEALAQEQAQKERDEIDADWDEAITDDDEWTRVREEERAREAAYEAYESAVNAKSSSSLANTRKAMLKHLSSINEDNA